MLSRLIFIIMRVLVYSRSPKNLNPIIPIILVPSLIPANKSPVLTPDAPALDIPRAVGVKEWSI